VLTPEEWQRIEDELAGHSGHGVRIEGPAKRGTMKSLSCEPAAAGNRAQRVSRKNRRGSQPRLNSVNHSGAIVQSHTEAKSITKNPREEGLKEGFEIYTSCIERMKSSGIKSHIVAARLLGQTASAIVPACSKDTALERLELAAGTLGEMAPSNSTEAMLATQMIAVHEAALLFIKSATQEKQTFDGCDANVLRATRLMQVFNEQLEAMQRLKGKAGQQKVTVEHVHVHEGGQAIVGAVTTREPGGGVGDDSRK
jgi:hypothetical protein